MYKLNLPLLESGYAVAEPSSTFSIPTKGGFSRYRADLDDASLIVSVGWQLTEQTYNQLMSFFKTGTRKGAYPFLIDLMIDDGTLVEYEAKFSSAGPQISQVVGLNYFVSDTLEVVPKPVDASFDTGVMCIYVASNGNPEQFLNLLNTIVNVKWPV